MDDVPAPALFAQDPPGLPAVQRWLQSVVTHPDGVAAGVESPEACSLLPLSRRDLERIVTRSEKLSAEDRLSIYANAYFARLLECLGDVFPVLKRTLGENAFNAFAFDYLQKYPSNSYTLEKLGERFPQYLDETRPPAGGAAQNGRSEKADWPDFLIDLARFEWVIAQVFDGPGLENRGSLTADGLHAIQADAWPHVRLKTAPSLRLLEARFPMNGFYTAVRNSADGAAVPLPAPADTYLAVSRRDYVVRRHELTHGQFVLLKVLHEGQTLGEALALLAAAVECDEETQSADLQDWFTAWTHQQFFEAILPPL